uniref:Uncharacterized protein n=1 Tax=Rhizophora mucronata TaxID=61149 RepID=A0A2P2P7W3_RHIMU
MPKFQSFHSQRNDRLDLKLKFGLYPVGFVKKKVRKSVMALNCKVKKRFLGVRPFK